MTKISLYETFEADIVQGKGEWIGSREAALFDVARANAYIADAGYEPVEGTTVPVIMVAGMVRRRMLGRISAVPAIVSNANNSLEASNHEDAYAQLCRLHRLRAVSPTSYWLGYVLPCDSLLQEQPGYHLILNTRGDLDDLHRSRRREIAHELVGNLANMKACVVVEDTDSVFDARSFRAIEPREAGIDFSVPW